MFSVPETVPYRDEERQREPKRKVKRQGEEESELERRAGQNELWE